jgi:hypothetical protein
LPCGGMALAICATMAGTIAAEAIHRKRTLLRVECIDGLSFYPRRFAGG